MSKDESSQDAAERIFGAVAECSSFGEWRDKYQTMQS